MARHLLERRVRDPHVQLALTLAAAIRVAPLPLAQVVPACAQSIGSGACIYMTVDGETVTKCTVNKIEKSDFS